ncbi:MAG TPA: polyprenyl synthetase family protein [Kiritimatiellia bacterium]|mgnify:FL=1|jgi:geranylgeranyl diphosphate synthase type II|nr:MAG: Farnesyl diphosphate synthase [Verrucomicrobia bacterium ADurb.Bin018]HOE00949.1 polyprenyl synthetase family protein [Kiritimatiellia bacterium]HOE36307.1 polyprenyl synthetase family protein [Kiritimatiellia bacterium]HOR73932.1 polyprenyl synthetase family protein [Kiritimatiellia bacterium]HOU58314.1 polyprenyl synthetase family protein [Kiritimatiellia bacterium]
MFDLPTYLAAGARWIEDALRRLVPPADTRPATLHAAIHHSLFAGGKRLRPILCAAAAEACGASREVALFPAAAIECLHTYTLIHDDLPCMDNDDLRRGQPTCHVVYGQAIALLAGDALQALAFELATRTPVATVEIIRELATAAGSTGVVGGQVEDIQGERLPPDADRLRYIQQHKTGDLIICACRMGMLAAGAPPTDLAAITDYAAAIGEAFQIADDILNATATPEQLGKAVGTDAAREKTTAVSVYGLAGARQRLHQLVATATAALAPLPGNTQPLAALAQHIATRQS